MFSDEEELQPLIPGSIEPSPKKNSLLAYVIVFSSLCSLLYISLSTLSNPFKNNIINQNLYLSKTASEMIFKTNRICSLDVGHIDECEGSLVNFYIPAKEDGLWPVGLSWTLLEDPKDLNQVMSRVQADFGPNSVQKNICSGFSKKICLSGDYVLYVSNENGNDKPSGDEKSVYIDICSSRNRVYAGEAFDFNAEELICGDKEESYALNQPASVLFPTLSYSTNSISLFTVQLKN